MKLFKRKPKELTPEQQEVIATNRYISTCFCSLDILQIYLFRIKVGDRYLLVKNNRGTEKYQPVGGVYQFKRGEKDELK